MKAFLERHTSFVSWMGGLGLPLAILVAGWLITSTSERSKLDTEYVRIALGILSASAKADDKAEKSFTAEELALRQWAVRLLNQKSPEKFSEVEQKALLETRSPFGQAGLEDATRESLAWAILESVKKSQSPPSSVASAPATK